ncbi:hypothetical protein llap_8004 [Limosa lapponica baueri]|uniref:Uncharacterized protein n=1 Tax=Limosa lapponica baueri TaxID=1758121 RepID=A0A2I0U6P5_LIMLA|nr:hypothetical protein llap_8004 [Limosa lapponica baueri]
MYGLCLLSRSLFLNSVEPPLQASETFGLIQNCDPSDNDDNDGSVRFQLVENDDHPPELPETPKNLSLVKIVENTGSEKDSGVSLLPECSKHGDFEHLQEWSHLSHHFLAILYADSDFILCSDHA